MKVTHFRYVYNGASARYVLKGADYGPLVHLAACPEGPITREDLADFHEWLQRTYEELIRKPAYAALPGFNALIVPAEEGSDLIILSRGSPPNEPFHRN